MLALIAVPIGFRLPRLHGRLAAWLAVVCCYSCGASLMGQIEQATDAPPPLAPAASLASMQLAPGFGLQLVAAEPLVAEPSGVCWDERGRLFVCELHGYNLEGQYDIEQLNRTGQLDRIVRRVQAADTAKQQALAGTYGTVKLLLDRDGDGQMDEARVWADRLPPCYGICPARGGLIVACAPDILFLADRDGDDKAEVREQLFTGFVPGALERGISNPQWGLDGWIYVGKGHDGGTISGPHLKQPVQLPSTDFRIRPDGSALEPVAGGTHTFGFAMTAAGERFVVSTATPGIYVAPIPWKDLSRNPDVATSNLELNALASQMVYPISQPHPWRTRRAADPGFAKYYTDRYGLAESSPNGYFTSACSPLVYQDSAMPALYGQLLGCEPAQNMLFRGLVRREGTALRLERPAAEAAREFLAAADPWFHPIALASAPDGSIYVVDFYREIIEDYSAIPRYLQQQYGLVNGRDRGRIYRLIHQDAHWHAAGDLTRRSAAELAVECVGSGHWLRQTARRLLVERSANQPALCEQAATLLRPAVLSASDPGAILNGLYTLADLGQITADDIHWSLRQTSPLVRVHGLRLSEDRLAMDPSLREAVVAAGLAAARADASGDEPLVILQAALTLGEVDDPGALAALSELARRHDDLRWVRDAVLTSLHGRAGELLVQLVSSPEPRDQTAPLLGAVCRAIAAGGRTGEVAPALDAIEQLDAWSLQRECLEGLAAGAAARPLELPAAARATLEGWTRAARPELRRPAGQLIRKWRLEAEADRAARLTATAGTLADLQQPPEARLAAAQALADEDDPAATLALLEAFRGASPQVQEAILAGLITRRERTAAVLDAIEQKRLPAAALSAVQKASLLQRTAGAERQRAERLLSAGAGPSAELLATYLAALAEPRDPAQGAALFRQHCGACHLLHGEGQNVGPNLNGEFQRAEEAIVRDILSPSESITAGYAAYTATTQDGRVVNGLIALESASSLTLRLPGGKEETVLRKDLEQLASLPVSLMPDDFARLLAPRDVAAVVAWLRAPTARRILFDEDERFAMYLDQGHGTVEFVSGRAFAGDKALRVTPPQRFSPRIPGWNFRIREQPEAGEYRYLRYAWRVEDAVGAMIELAQDGRWPSPTSAPFRYVAGLNQTRWQALRVADEPPRDWTVVTRDLWSDLGDCTITGVAPTAMGGAVLFDRFELLRTLDADERPPR